MDDIPVKQPPHSIEAEQSVLGGLMLNNNAWLDLAGRLSEDDFYREDHRLIFRGIRELLDVGKPCDFVTLSEYLRGRGSLDPAGGLSYLGSLANDTPSAANVLAYADIVRERAVLRSLIQVGQEIADLGFRPGEQSYADLMETAEQRVFAIREQGERGHQEFQRVGEALDKVEARLEILRERPDELAGVPTGLHDLDRKIHGLSKGDLLILAGRPGMGKTSFAMNIAEHVAIHEKKPVGVFSMEMGADQLAMRILASYCRMDQSALRSGQIEDHQWDWLAQASRDIREAPLFIDETPALSPLELRARARRMKRRHGLS
ncbi:MAG: replicative DNA helicase, partial [Algiphilus sp.]